MKRKKNEKKKHMKNIFIHFLKCWIGFLDTQSLAIYFHRDSYGSEYENKNGVCIKLGNWTVQPFFEHWIFLAI